MVGKDVFKSFQAQLLLPHKDMSNRLIDDFDVDYVLKTILAAAAEEGYKLRQTITPQQHHKVGTVYERWSARHNERGVKYAFEIYTAYLNGLPNKKSFSVEQKRQDHRGRFMRTLHERRSVDTTTHMPYWGGVNWTWRDWLHNFVKLLRKARGETITAPVLSTNSLAGFMPLEFTKPGYFVDDMTGDAIMKCFYKSCRVCEVVSILPSLKISHEEVAKPNTEPWFYIVGDSTTKSSLARPEIIVREQNGKLVFYPIRNKKITNELQPKNTYIDYETITELDGLLVEKAIKNYLNKLEQQ